MKATIVSVPDECFDPLYDSLTEGNIDNINTFAGRMAAVCYLNGKYFDDKYYDIEKSISRFKRVAITGHHSIADHCFITVLFEGIPKMTAMILNSTGFYNTSEKSGRYTVMSDTDEKYTQNRILYNKWIEKFKTLIKEYDSTLDDKLVEKLSLENARYMLSIFAPSTTMTYTTSIRMWSYIRQWCKDYIDIYDDNGASLDLVRTDFNNKLLECIKDLYDCINKAHLYSDDIIDYKRRNFRFLANQTFYNIDKTTEHYTEMYLIKYKASFADLAQQQRHRTLHYYMCFDGSKDLEFYIPELLNKYTEYKQEWLNDLMSVKNTYPIATKVKVIETGDICDFMYKCDERLCGRVQLETMNTIINNLHKFARQWNKSPYIIGQLNRHIKDDNVLMKCHNEKCKEPCHWGPVKALQRLI